MTIVLSLSISVLEMILGVISLPHYLYKTYKVDPDIFNQDGFSYTLYKFRRRIALSSVSGIVFLIAFVLFSSLFVSTDPTFAGANTTIQFSNASASGGEGTTSVNIQVELNASSGQDQSADYAVVGGTADPADYTLDDGTVTVTSGGTTANIGLTITDDSVYEQPETIIIELTNPTDGSIGANSFFTFTITDDDFPTVNFATSSKANLQTDWSGGLGASTSTQYNAQSNIAVTTTGQLSLETSSSSWYNSAWPYRKKITIDQNQVSSTQSNFPVLVTGANFDSHFFSNIKSDGTDLVFTAANGTTLLNREVVAVSSTVSTMEVWVNVTSISDAADTDIYVYYGNPAAAVTNDTGTWNSNFEAVYHFEEDPSITTDGSCGGSIYSVCDSTANGNHGTSTSFATESATTTHLGTGYTFDGSSQYINVGQDSSISTLSPKSVTFWLNPDSAAGNGRKAVIAKRGGNCAAGGDWFLEYDDSNNVWFNGQFNAVNQVLNMETDGPTDIESVSADASLTEDVWTYAASVVDSSYVPYFYANAVELGYAHRQTGTAPSSDLDCDLQIGVESDDLYFYAGALDEVRVLSTNLSNQWIETEYNNQSSPGTFYSVASVENYYVASGTLTSNIFNIATSTHEWGVVRYVADGAVSTTVKIRTDSNSDMSGATAFSSCSVITNGDDITGNSCVTDGHQYVQYQIGLTRVATTTPIFKEIEIEYLEENSFSYLEDAGSFVITAAMSSSTTSTVSVPYTVGGTATAGSDHSLTDGTISISAGSLSGSVTVSITDESTFESDETIVVTMGTPTNAVAGSITVVTSTIVNDDAEGSQSTLVTPSTPTVGTPTQTSLDVTINESGNVATTEFAIYNVTDSNYIDASGASSATAVHQTTSSWGGAVTVTGLSVNTSYQFLVQGLDTSGTSASSTTSTASYTSVASDRQLATEDTATVTSDQTTVTIDGTPGGNTGTFTSLTTPEGIAETRSVSLDLGRLLQTRQVNISEQISATRPSNDRGSDFGMTIPASSVITADSDDWDGQIKIPTVIDGNSLVTPPRVGTIKLAIKVGSELAQLNFDNAVKLVFPGEAGERAAYQREGENSSTEITTICNSPSDSNNIVGSGECKVDSGLDLIIWTKHLTDYFTFNLGEGGGSAAPVARVSPSSPQVDFVQINYGAKETDTRDVIVNLNIVGAIEVAFSENSNFKEASFVPFARVMKWRLPPGDGLKTIYVRFRTANGATVDDLAYIKLKEVKIETPVEDINVEKQEEILDEEEIECSLETKKPYKIKDEPAVYYITERCTGQAFKTPFVYFEYFSSWSEVNIVSSEDLEKINRDEVKFVPNKLTVNGASLIKVYDLPKTYLALENILHWIRTEKVFNALNFTWDKVREVTENRIETFEVGENITTTNTEKYAELEAVKKLIDSGEIREIVIGEKIEEETKVDIGIEEKFKRTMKVGDRSEEVKLLQDFLKELGFFTFPRSTGYYGSLTESAVRAFQVDNNLPTTGLVDDNTLDKLNSL